MSFDERLNLVEAILNALYLEKLLAVDAALDAKVLNMTVDLRKY